MIWTVILCSVALTMVNSKSLTQKRQDFGICDEECSNNIFVRALGFGSCPIGYICRSNGCGHSCQRDSRRALTQKRPLIGTCDEECSNNVIARSFGFGSCPAGYVCRSNGCGHSCQKDSSIFHLGPIDGLCIELCGTGCQDGFECRSIGCGHMCQPVSS